MHPFTMLTLIELDKSIIDDHQYALVRSAHSEIGPIRRSTGAAFIRLGEWLRGRAGAASEVSAEPATTTMKAA